MEATTVERAYLSYSEAEQYTGLNRVTLWRAVRAGNLRLDGSGRAVRFHRKELDRFMQSRDLK
jgi:excisionase family DNA binding protein